MGRVRHAFVAAQGQAELFAFLSRRAARHHASGHAALAADYVVRSLMLRPRDAATLVAGAELGGRVGQPDLTHKCLDALAKLPARRRGAAGEALLAAPPEALLARCPPASEETLVVAATASVAEVQASLDKATLPAVRGAVQVRQDGSFGRGVYATRPIAEGTELMRDTPFVAVRASPRHCSHCLLPLTPDAALPCDGCPAEAYCSEPCRTEAMHRWHAVGCTNEALAEWAFPMVQAGADPVALGCLAVARICAVATLRQEHPLALAEVRALAGTTTYDPAAALSESGALVVGLSEALQQPHLCLEDFLSLFAIVQTNEFRGAAGTALFPSLSLLNHSCCPNAALRRGTARGEQVLVATRALHSGEQVFIDYNPAVSALRYEQRRQLCAQRHFECFCAKCVRRE